jgi:branched-chain amino acid transport system ATP-binding protein
MAGARPRRCPDPLLLLDEWLAGLNPELEQGIALIQCCAAGHHRLLVEHVMDAIRSLCDRCSVNAGRFIATGLPGEFCRS